jgi:membrane protein
LNIVSLIFTVAAVVGMLAAVAAVVAIPLVLSDVGLGAIAQTVIRIGRWPALVLIMLLGLALLYRYGPSRTRARWQWLSVGSMVANRILVIRIGGIVVLSR